MAYSPTVIAPYRPHVSCARDTSLLTSGSGGYYPWLLQQCHSRQCRLSQGSRFHVLIKQWWLSNVLVSVYR